MTSYRDRTGFGDEDQLKRNVEMCVLFLKGRPTSKIAKQFEVTPERVAQIVHRLCKNTNPEAYKLIPEFNKRKWLVSNGERFIGLIERLLDGSK